jgi:hypothetical protein
MPNLPATAAAILSLSPVSRNDFIFILFNCVMASAEVSLILSASVMIPMGLVIDQ